MRRWNLLVFAACFFGCSSGTEHMRPRTDPDEPTATPSATAQPGTTDCIEEGSEIPNDAQGATCCPDLVRVDEFKGSILRLDSCEKIEGGRAFCIRCGDGKCGVGENSCTCRQDCQWP